MQGGLLSSSAAPGSAVCAGALRPRVRTAARVDAQGRWQAGGSEPPARPADGRLSVRLGPGTYAVAQLGAVNGERTGSPNAGAHIPLRGHRCERARAVLPLACLHPRLEVCQAPRICALTWAAVRGAKSQRERLSMSPICTV